LQRFFAQKPVARTAGAPLPEIHETSKAVIVAPPKAPLRDAPLPRRTRTVVNVEKQRQIDDLSSAMGYPRRTFEAMDSQHVFIVGTDGVLRFEQGPFNSGGVEAGKSAVASEIVDRNVVTFEAGSEREVLVLKADGAC
jgi:hypothetical protein